MDERQIFSDYRKKQGLTQQQAADLAMISRRQVQKIERGDSVGTKSRFALADALGIPANKGFNEISRSEVGLASRSIESADALLAPPSRLDQSLQRVPDNPDLGRRFSAAEVEFNVRRMRRSWQRHLDLSSRKTGNSEYVQFAADQYLNENVEAYVQRYMELWHHLPDVIQISRVRGRKTGMSVVLPVSADAYRELKLGQKSFMEVGTDDLQRNSGHLVVDSLVEFDDAPRRQWYDVTSSLRDAIIWQVIHLAGYPLPESLRILSFGASPSNAKRLQASGFVELRQPMKDLGYALFEFARDNSDLEEVYTRCESSKVFASLISRLLSDKSSVSARLRVKRAAIMGTMQMLQNIDQFRQNREAG